jgi:hypothetical protein
MRVLGLFAKKPEPGQVKTRLASPSSPAWAAQVAAAFLDDLLDKLSVLDAQRILVFSPPPSASYFTEHARGRYTLQAQADGSLGQRLTSFFSGQLRDGAAQVVALGTDSPNVPLDYVEQAFRALESANVVLGPATDGGYYLVGCSCRLPPIFDDMEWSTSRVLADTVARLQDPSWRLTVLPPWYDVDTLDDWHVLRGHLAALRRAGIDPGVPRTEQLSLALIDRG